MVTAEADEVVGGGLSAVLPVCDVVDFSDCVSTSGESALPVVSDGDCFAHRQWDDSFEGGDCVKMPTGVQQQDLTHRVTCEASDCRSRNRGHRLAGE